MVWRITVGSNEVFRFHYTCDGKLLNAFEPRCHVILFTSKRTFFFMDDKL